MDVARHSDAHERHTVKDCVKCCTSMLLYSEPKPMRMRHCPLASLAWVKVPAERRRLDVREFPEKHPIQS